MVPQRAPMVARYGSKIDGERIHLNWSFSMDLKVCTTWLFNIAMENGSFSQRFSHSPHVENGPHLSPIVVSPIAFPKDVTMLEGVED